MSNLYDNNESTKPRAALLVLDFINDIVHPNGKIAGSAAFIKEHAVIENANKVISFARFNNIPVIFVKVGFSANYLECPERSPIFGGAKQKNALKLNEWGTEFHELLDVQPNDMIITKHRVSAFYATDLEAVLRPNHIDTLLITGVSTDMAVQTTAREAHDRDYKVIIVADACASGSAEIHESALKLLQRVATIINTSDLNADNLK